MKTPQILLVLLALTGCAASPRERAPTLVKAEAQYIAVARLESPDAAVPTGVGQHAYEWGVVLPLSYLGAALGGGPIFAAYETVQILAWPVYWGQQDLVVEGSVATYRQFCGFWKLHGAFPPAGGGASYASEPDPHRLDGPRGDAPR